MAKPLDYRDDIARIQSLTSKEEQAKEYKELAGRKRREIGGLRGILIKVCISGEAPAGFTKAKTKKYFTGRGSDIDENNFRLDDCRPRMDTDEHKTFRILYVERL